MNLGNPKGPISEHCGVPSNEQTCVENSDIHIKDNLKDINTTSSLADIPQNQQQLEFVQAAPDSPVTYHNASYDDDIRELTEYWYLHKKARCYGSHHQYRLHNFKGCVAALVSATTTSTGNKPWRSSRHAFSFMLTLLIPLTGISSIIKGWSTSTWLWPRLLIIPLWLTDLPSITMFLNAFMITYILPLHRAGKVFNEKAILYRIKTRLNHDFDIIGEDAVLTIVQKVLGHDC
ncbi:MAG: hypothetical protein VX677_03795 [Candidatus Poribacteria bacterium]|nr:hypothetical protein [Candidatus Poribacteria bacterium]